MGGKRYYWICVEKTAGCQFIAADYGYGEIIDDTEIMHIEELIDILEKL